MTAHTKGDPTTLNRLYGRSSGHKLRKSQQELVGPGGAQQVVSGFTLEVAYVQPPMEFLQTIPLFEGSSATQTETQDTTAAPAAPGI